MPGTSKKLVLVLATFALVTEASRKDEVILERVPCVHYPLHFHKDKENKLRTLINLGSKINAMTPAYVSKLGLRVRHTDVGAQKIDGSTLETFEIVLTNFQVEDKLGRARFFQETFLLANTSVELILGMFFLALSNADI